MAAEAHTDIVLIDKSGANLESLSSLDIKELSGTLSKETAEDLQASFQRTIRSEIPSIYHPVSYALVYAYDATKPESFEAIKTNVDSNKDREKSIPFLVAYFPQNAHQVDLEDAKNFADENQMYFMETSANDFKTANELFAAICYQTRLCLDFRRFINSLDLYSLLRLLPNNVDEPELKQIYESMETVTQALKNMTLKEYEINSAPIQALHQQLSLLSNYDPKWKMPPETIIGVCFLIAGLLLLIAAAVAIATSAGASTILSAVAIKHSAVLMKVGTALLGGGGGLSIFGGYYLNVCRKEANQNQNEMINQKEDVTNKTKNVLMKLDKNLKQSIQNIQTYINEQEQWQQFSLQELLDENKYDLILRKLASFAEVDILKQYEKVLEAIDVNICDFINETSSNGKTALHWAAGQAEPEEIIEFLVKKGADESLTDNEDNTYEEYLPSSANSFSPAC